MSGERMLPLILPLAVLSAFLAFGEGAGTAFDAIQAQPDLSKFAEALTDIGYADKLKNASWTGTIFAPPNDVLNKLVGSTPKAAMQTDPTFAAIIKYHIVPRESLTKAQLENDMHLATAADNDAIVVEISAVNGTVLKSGVNTVKIVKPDIPAGAGFIQELDGLLIPFSVAVKMQAAQAQQGGAGAAAGGAAAAGATAQPQQQQPAPQLIQPNLRRRLSESLVQHILTML
eukprot:jgi/Botrbrau1/18661/Bobra.0849s0001.1